LMTNLIRKHFSSIRVSRAEEGIYYDCIRAVGCTECTKGFFYKDLHGS
jgi:hypothetical protein